MDYITKAFTLAEQDHRLTGSQLASNLLNFRGKRDLVRAIIGAISANKLLDKRIKRIRMKLFIRNDHLGVSTATKALTY